MSVQANTSSVESHVLDSFSHFAKLKQHIRKFDDKPFFN